MNVSSSPLSTSRNPGLAGGVAGLVGTRGVASAQFAAAAKLLKLGAAMDGPATQLLQSATAAMDARGDALAAVASGLGEMLDVYA